MLGDAPGLVVYVAAAGPVTVGMFLANRTWTFGAATRETVISARGQSARCMPAWMAREPAQPDAENHHPDEWHREEGTLDEAVPTIDRARGKKHEEREGQYATDDRIGSKIAPRGIAPKRAREHELRDHERQKQQTADRVMKAVLP